MQDALRYNVYIRKSSEEEDRQAPSLESQWENLEPIIKTESLNVVNIYQEACSAKRHGKRDEFYRMTKDIEKGIADAILVWSPNRISRNAVDTGLVIDLLDREKLLEIKTPGQIFKSNPSDKFFFSLLCSQAKLENDNKGLDVKRGLKHKAEMGWHPGRMRVGYISGEEEKGYKTIQKDPSRFVIVKKMLHKVCEDKQSPASILKLATEKWGLTRPKNGKPLGYSTWYDMLHDPFYYGKFEYPAESGKWYKGKHTPMITKKQFDKIQQILGRVDKAKPKTHEFLFTGLMKCGECGRSITAERKTKLLKSGEQRQYTYYHCSRRFKEQCSQGSVREHQIHQALSKKLQTIKLSTPIFKHLISTVKMQLTRGHEQRNQRQKTYESELQSCETKLAALIDMRACGELTQNEFLERKNALTKEKEVLIDNINHSQINPEKVLANLKSLQEFIDLALDRLRDSNDIQGIKRILKIICSNQEIIDKKPVVTLKMPFQLFACPVKGTYPENGVARTEKTRITKGKTCLREDQFPVMLREPDDVRTFLENEKFFVDVFSVVEDIEIYKSSMP